MTNKKMYKSFQIFQQQEQAEEIKMLLDKEEVDSKLIVKPSTFDATIAITREQEIELFVLDSDLVKAKNIVDKLVDLQVDTADREHYLFGFSDEELYEISLKPEEWSTHDVKLAERILNERGSYDPKELLVKIKKQQSEESPKPSKNKWVLIAFGYLFILLCLIIAVIIGGHLYYSKRGTRLDGEIIYKFTEHDRKHGKIILIICSMLIVAAVILYFVNFKEFLNQLD